MDVQTVTKIDIGSGTRPTPGFTTVDLYQGADIKADIQRLPFADNQIEEAVCNHVLEHLPYKEVDSALLEVKRVLKSGGIFRIEVPDLEWILSDWLHSDEVGRWGHRLERIFGQECHPGDFHRGGFTQNRLIEKLIEADFVNVSVEKKIVDFHDGVLQATAYKS